MRIGIYGRSITNTDIGEIDKILSIIRAFDISICIESNYAALLAEAINLEGIEKFRNTRDLLDQNISVLISLGGDGTLLDTLNYVSNTLIPVMGINLGRLGFLSNIAREDAQAAIYALKNGHFRIDKRSLLEVKSDNDIFAPFNYALNDFTIHKRDTGSMISTEVYLIGEFFTNYWVVGLIVATPTGSTAYSLSCGGPIVFPDSGNFVITPVAPHNLNIRPIILSDTTVISFRVSGRGTNHLVSLDSRYQTVEYMKEIAVQKAPFFLNLVKLNNQNFINTLREKLKWGLDSRNIN
jgi:NAD+ kinase